MNNNSFVLAIFTRVTFSCAVLWIAFGLWMKVFAWIDGNADVFANGFGTVVNGVIVIAEALLLIAVCLFAHVKWLKIVLVVVFAGFTVVHVLVITGLIAQCSCFPGLYVPEWFMLVVNAALALSSALLLLNPSRQGEQGSRIDVSLLIFAQVVAAICASIIFYADIEIFENHSVNVSGVSQFEVMNQFTVGDSIFDLDSVSPVLTFFSESRGLIADNTNIYFYDSSCTHCMEKLPFMIDQAIDDLMYYDKEWVFVNTGRIADPRTPSLSEYTCYRHIPDMLIAVPMLIHLSGGKMTRIARH